MDFINIQEHPLIMINRYGEVKSTGPRIYFKKDPFDNRVFYITEPKTKTFSLPRLMIKYFLNSGKDYCHQRYKIEYKDGNPQNTSIMNLKITEYTRPKKNKKQEEELYKTTFKLGEI